MYVSGPRDQAASEPQDSTDEPGGNRPACAREEAQAKPDADLFETDGEGYALEITGNSMLPVYREGDIVIVSPKAALRKGDRVVVKTTAGKVMAKIMQRKTAKRIELASFSARKTQVLEMKDVDWMARIIWASQ